MLRQYFMASRSRDNVTLGNIATVGFNPTEQGIVESFDVVSVTPDETKPLRVKELAAAVAEAQKAADEFAAKKREYQDTNIDAIGRVIKAEAASTPLRGADAEIQAAWTKWREDEGVHSKAVNDARQALSAERAVADVSLANKNVDLTTTDATLTTRNVSIKASVKTPQGATESRDMAVVFQKAEATGGAAPVEGKWIITSVK
jgi:Flp pilus assembly CpaE family ATPase